jgi:glycosyltransferase involved in cell wall biosynthesis
LVTLHVDLGRQWRGGQNQALLAIEGLRSRNHKAELVALRGSPLAERARAAGVTVHEAAPSPALLTVAGVIKEQQRHIEFDVVHCHDANGLTAAWIARAHRRSRVIASRRVAYPLSRNPLARARYLSASKIAAVSRFVADSVTTCGIGEDHVAVVYDGVAIPPLPSPAERAAARATWNIPPGAPLLGCVGYLLPEKGQALLLRALPHILRSRPDTRLLLAGAGPCRPALEQLARELDVTGSVVFAGLVPQVETAYAAMDLFAFPSIAEPLGSSLLAAMAHGTPAVAVGRGAVPEIITDGADGLLTEPEPPVFAAAALRVLNQPELAARLASAGRARIEARFSADRMVEDTLELYRRVCAG